MAECLHTLGLIDEMACEGEFIGSQLRKLVLAGQVIRREHSSRHLCYALDDGTRLICISLQ